MIGSEEERNGTDDGGGAVLRMDDKGRMDIVIRFVYLGLIVNIHPIGKIVRFGQKYVQVCLLSPDACSELTATDRKVGLRPTDRPRLFYSIANSGLASPSLLFASRFLSPPL